MSKKKVVYLCVYICEYFLIKVPFLENNLYDSDAVSHQKEGIFNED